MSPDPETVLGAARAWLGTPYRHRASSLGAGCDCLGLLRGVWRTLYGGEAMAVPNYAPSLRDPAHIDALQAAAETLLLAEDGPPGAGQVVLFRLSGQMAPRHCGILVTSARFIHAQERLGVVEADLTEPWARRMAGR
jgi:NlpC/P60 family putative phage cell wall peptidase